MEKGYKIPIVTKPWFLVKLPKYCFLSLCLKVFKKVSFFIDPGRLFHR